jgi:hypothetical protein
MGNGRCGDGFKGRLTISAPASDRVANVNGGQVFLTGMTLSGGWASSPSSYGASAQGGCLYIVPGATLTLDRGRDRG